MIEANALTISVIALSFIFLVAILSWSFYKYGRISVLKEQATENGDIKGKQLDAVVNRVDATDRLLDHSF